MSNPTQQSSPPSNQQPQRPAYTSQSSQQGRSSVPSPYPYGAYVAQSPGIYGSPQVSGAYPYQSTYTPGMPGYGAWPVFNYTSQTAQQGARPTPARQTTVQPIPVAPGASTPTVASTPQPPSLQTRFSAHGSSNVRETAAPATGRGRKQASKGLFTKELKNLMFAFGDDRNPSNDTVNVMEEILVEFLTDVCATAGGSNKKTRLSIEELRPALSRPADAKKLARMEELMFMQEDIKRARAQFETEDRTKTF